MLWKQLGAQPAWCYLGQCIDLGIDADATQSLWIEVSSQSGT